MLSSTALFSSRLNVHRAQPFGGSEQARAISLASAARSKPRGLAEADECLPFLDNLLAGSGDGREAGVQGVRGGPIHPTATMLPSGSDHQARLTFHQ